MDLNDVRARVDYIRSIKGDDEAAHSAEDDLWLDLLGAIAAGECPDPQACAAEAVKTHDIDFARWFA